MPYVPNPSDPTQPVDSVMAGTAAAEFRALKAYLSGLADSGRNLRLPVGESFAEMATKMDWANMMLAFNASGNPIPVLPASGSASDVLVWLANSVNAAAGAGAIGFTRNLLYIPNTVGAELNKMYTPHVFKGSGIAGDDTVALAAFYAALPDWSTLVIEGIARITADIVFDRNIGIEMPTPNDAIYVDIGVTGEGVILHSGSPALVNGVNGLYYKMNVYGDVNCSKHLLTAIRMDRSAFKLKLRGGCTRTALRMRGCLINDWDIQSSGNYQAPVTTGFQVDHVEIDNYGIPTVAFGACTISGPASPAVVTRAAHGYVAGNPVVFEAPVPDGMYAGKLYYVSAAGLGANTFQVSETNGGASVATTSAGTACTVAACTPMASNTNRLVVNLEGGRHGVYQWAMPGEGANTVLGEIEGLTGRPMDINFSLGFVWLPTKCEANVQSSYFDNCADLTINNITNLGDDVTYSRNVFLTNCRGYSVNSYFGRLDIESNCLGGALNGCRGPDLNWLNCRDFSCIQISPNTHANNATTMGGGPGFPTMVTHTVNPFGDIFDTVASNVGPPLNYGMQAAYIAGDLVSETGVVWSRSAFPHSIKCISRGTTVTNGLIFTPGDVPWPAGSTEWASVCTAIQFIGVDLMAELYLDDDLTFHLIGQTQLSAANVWQEIRGVAKPRPGQNWRYRIAIKRISTGLYVTGFQYYCAGFNYVRGPIPPMGIENSISRQGYIHTSVSQIPHRRGAMAEVAGVGYFAVGNGAVGDWKQIT